MYSLRSRLLPFLIAFLTMVVHISIGAQAALNDMDDNPSLSTENIATQISDSSIEMIPLERVQYSYQWTFDVYPAPEIPIDPKVVSAEEKYMGTFQPIIEQPVYWPFEVKIETNKVTYVLP